MNRAFNDRVPPVLLARTTAEARCGPNRASGGLPDGFVVEHGRGGEVVAERGEVLEGPDDLLVARDLDELRVVGAGVAVADDEVPAGEPFQGGDPLEVDPGELVLLDPPDDLARGVDLDDPIAAAGGDEGVAFGGAQGAE